MNIEDEGIIINIAHYSETSAIVHILTKEHGRMAGLYRGAFKKNAGIVQIGNQVSFNWRAKNETQLGNFTSIDLLKNHFVLFMNDILRLYALQSASALCFRTLPEKHPYSQVYNGFIGLLNSLEIDDFIAVYVFWEIGLLKSLGFEMDLSKCTACGKNEDLIYVSPNSAKAVCSGDGEIYKDKLLKLPRFLLNKSAPNDEDVMDALKLTGFFIERRVFNSINKTTPEARNRFVNEFKKVVSN